jgi:outer membrane protein assembly factor BamB
MYPQTRELRVVRAPEVHLLRKTFIAHTFLILLLCSCAASLAGDWPQWRGPDRTGHVPQGVPVPANLDLHKVMWHIGIGDGVASPVVGDGKVVYIDNQNAKETVHSVDAATGKELWNHVLDDVTHDQQSKPGPRCTPLIDGDRVYAQSCRGELHCINAADGKLIWRVSYVRDFGAIFIGEKGKAEGASRHGYAGSPLIDGDHLIVEAGGQHDAAVVCLDKKNGKVIWKSLDEMPGYAAPIEAELLGAKQIIAFMAESVVGLDPTHGKLLWRGPVKTSLGRNVTTPIVVGDRVLVASHQVGLLGIKVSKDSGGYVAETEWAAKESAINFSSPVAVGDYLYGVGPNKNLICVDVRTGKQTWSKDGFFPGTSGGSTHAGFNVMDKSILVLTNTGELVLIAADPKEFHGIGRTQICGQNWCNPAYADGKLFLRDAKSLMCIDLLK